jgi:ATP-dependent DNA ligase
VSRGRHAFGRHVKERRATAFAFARDGVARSLPGRGWVHEIKHDSYRLIATVRLFTRRLSVSGQLALS